MRNGSISVFWSSATQGRVSEFHIGINCILSSCHLRRTLSASAVSEFRIEYPVLTCPLGSPRYRFSISQMKGNKRGHTEIEQFCQTPPSTWSSIIHCTCSTK